MNRSAEKLVKRFNAASLKRMARANAKGAPTQPLFHYTTEEALYSIMRSETFWFTSIYYMDDDAELSFGFNVARDLLKTAMQSEGVLTKAFLKPLVDDYKFDRAAGRQTPVRCQAAGHRCWPFA